MSERRIPVFGVKNADGSYAKVPPAETPGAPPTVKEEPKADADLDNLLSKCLIILDREVRHLMMLSMEKLNKDNAHSLREHTKLIMDLKKREKELLDDLPEGELEKLVGTKNED